MSSFPSYLKNIIPVFESYQKKLTPPNQKSQSLLPMIPLPTLLPIEVRYRFFWALALFIYVFTLILSVFHIMLPDSTCLLSPCIWPLCPPTLPQWKIKFMGKKKEKGNFIMEAPMGQSESCRKPLYPYIFTWKCSCQE